VLWCNEYCLGIECVGEVVTGLLLFAEGGRLLFVSCVWWAVITGLMMCAAGGR